MPPRSVRSARERRASLRRPSTRARGPALGRGSASCAAAAWSTRARARRECRCPSARAAASRRTKRSRRPTSTSQRRAPCCVGGAPLCVTRDTAVTVARTHRMRVRENANRRSRDARAREAKALTHTRIRIRKDDDERTVILPLSTSRGRQVFPVRSPLRVDHGVGRVPRWVGAVRSWRLARGLARPLSESAFACAHPI